MSEPTEDVVPETSEWRERLDDGFCDNVLNKIGVLLESAPPRIRGAVAIAASEDTSFLGGLCPSLKHEIYSRAREVLREWILDQVAPGRPQPEDDS